MNEILEKYKSMMCTHCVNRNKENGKCNIVIKINEEADCINYKCEDYCRKKRNRK